MTDKSVLLKAFNDHFSEFINDVQNVFPNDVDILATKNALMLLRKANPRMIIDVWHRHITLLYQDHIDNLDISFFLEKDYANDVKSSEHTNKILNKIDVLRGPISEMSEDNKNKTMKYIQNLSKLTNLYFLN